MATIRIHDEANTTIENQEEVASFLDRQEVIYEQWILQIFRNSFQRNMI